MATSGKAKVGSTARKVIDRIRQARLRQHDLDALMSGRDAAEELKAAGFVHHPGHMMWTAAVNHVSVMVEQLSGLDEMEALADFVVEAQEEYLPDGPPMSPLSRSYFTMWSFFDGRAPRSKETFGSVFLEVGAAFGMPADLHRRIAMLQESRMGVYLCEGSDGGGVDLCELVTGARCRAVVPAGYPGRSGELWYARVLPPPPDLDTEHVVMMTPYVLLRPGYDEWMAYFNRVLPAGPPEVRLAAYADHMKYGPKRHYWNEFVFEAYANHCREAVFLIGLPDVARSRPHSRVNR